MEHAQYKKRKLIRSPGTDKPAGGSKKQPIAANIVLQLFAEN
jgi:hypothetical protein